MENLDQIDCSVCNFRENSLFKSCSQENIKKYLNNKNSSIFKEGEFIVKQNDAYKGIYCIQQGLVKISKMATKDNSAILRFAWGGDIIGLGPFVNKDNYSYSAEVIKDTTVCFIPGDEFQSLIENDPEANLALMKMLCKKIDFIEDRVSDLIQKNTKKRIAELLLGLSQAGGNTQNKITEFKYEDLANLSGTTKNYFNKIMSSLNKAAVIRSYNNEIEIRNAEKLKEIAEA